MITERFQAPGSWDLQLQGVPSSIWDDIRPGGLWTWASMFVLPAAAPAVSATDLPTVAYYGGVLHKVNPEAETLSGMGMLWHLGGDKIGQVVDVNGPGIPTTDLTLDQWVPRIFNGHSPWGWGHAALPGVALSTGAYTHRLGAFTHSDPVWMSRADLLKWLIDIYKGIVEFRVLPSGLVQVGTWLTLYPGVVAPRMVRAQLAGSGSTGAAITQRLTADIDSEAVIDAVVMSDGPTIGLYGAYPPWHNAPRGESISRGMAVERSDATAHSVQDLAEAEYLARSKIAERITVDLDDYIAEGGSSARPVVGGFCYLYDPLLGIVGPDEMPWRGSSIWPDLRRIVSWRWPVTEGMRVALQRWSPLWGYEALDLTPYVVPESGSGSLEITSAARPINPE